MGCDQSRQKDEQESTRRERQPASRSDAAPQAARQVTSPPMGIAGSRLGSNPPQGQSYTDQRINEEDLFANITNRTADMFINISELMETMEVRDVKGLSKAYKSMVAAQRNIRSNLRMLPLASDTCAQPEVALSAPLACGQPEREYMQGLSAEVADALKAFAIVSGESIVAYLPDAKGITA